MYIDSLAQLSRAIDAALEALFVPTVLLLGAALLVMAGAEISARVRRRRRRAAGRIGSARQPRVKQARGAEA
jgi:hypothetical protein